MAYAKIILANIKEMILNNSLSAVISTYYRKPNESMEEYQQHLVWQQTTRLKLLNQIDDALKVVPEDLIVKKVYAVMAETDHDPTDLMMVFSKEETANKFRDECELLRSHRPFEHEQLEKCKELNCLMLVQYLLTNPEEIIRSYDRFTVLTKEVLDW